MSREEIQKLIGGYATDTLSVAERRALFEAALEDQELFNELANEQGLRDALQDPSARRQLVDALGPPRRPARLGVWQWLRQPAPLAVVGGTAILLVVAGLGLRRSGVPARPENDLAQVRSPLPKPSSPPVIKKTKPAPLPAKPEARFAKSTALVRQLDSQPSRERLTVARGAFLQSASSLGMRYDLLLKGADGRYAPTPFDTVFHPGNAVRLRLVPNNSEYLYLFQRNSYGGWQFASTQRVLRAQPCLLPATGAFEADQPGRKELLIVLSPREESSVAGLETAQLDALAASASAGTLTAPVASTEKVAVAITLEFR